MQREFKRICCYNLLALQAFTCNSDFTKTGKFSGTYKSIPVCLLKPSNEELFEIFTDGMVSVYDKVKDTSMEDLTALGVDLFPNGTTISSVRTTVAANTLFILIKEEDFDKIYNRE